MSIWLNNIALQHDTEAATSEDNMNPLANNNPLYARSSDFIDKISIRIQNLRHANASGENNPHFSSAKGVISSPNKTLRLPANFGGASSAFYVPPTGLDLGSDFFGASSEVSLPTLLISSLLGRFLSLP